MTHYRPDIDALRAVAVSLVLLYHADVPLVPGGFVGVDIFFVISGFLIASIIRRGLSMGTFSLRAFYENRIRRILPALLVVSAVILVAAFFIYPTDKSLSALAKSTRWALVAASNFYFFANTGYFDLPALSHGMLHTWSLGVEEQFYLIFPFIMLACNKVCRSRTGMVLALLLSASLLFSAVFIFFNQSFTFYMLPTRAWEPLLGACLAVSGWTPQGQKGKTLCMGSGLLLILVCACTYHGIFNWPFPGLAAIGPCAGAALFIAGGTGMDEDNRLRATLCRPGIVFVGLISYSLYLWHWPLIVFYKMFFITTSLTLFEGMGLILVSTGLAYLSWRFVERPVRKKPVFFRRTVLYPAAVGSVLILIIASNQVRRPFLPENAVAYAASRDDWVGYKQPVQPWGDSGTTPSVLLLGDSHAGMLIQYFNAVGKRDGFGGNFIYASIFDSLKTQNIEASFQEHGGRPDRALIAVRWAAHLYGLLPGEMQQDGEQRQKLSRIAGDTRLEGSEALLPVMREALDFIQDKVSGNIYILLPVPEQEYVIPQAATQLARRGKESSINETIGLPLETYLARNGAIINVLEQIADEYPRVRLVDPRPLLFDTATKRFMVVHDGRCLYTDDDHLSIFGSWFIEPVLKQVHETLFTSGQPPTQ